MTRIIARQRPASTTDRSPWRRTLRPLGLLLLCTAGLLLMPAESQAITNTMVSETYYSDPNFTDQVGWRMVHRCIGGGGPLHGEVGPYVLYEQTWCRDYPPQTERRCFIYEWVESSSGNHTVVNFWPITCPGV